MGWCGSEILIVIINMYLYIYIFVGFDCYIFFLEIFPVNSVVHHTNCDQFVPLIWCLKMQYPPKWLEHEGKWRSSIKFGASLISDKSICYICWDETFTCCKRRGFQVRCNSDSMQPSTMSRIVLLPGIVVKWWVDDDDGWWWLMMVDGSWFNDG